MFVDKCLLSEDKLIHVQLVAVVVCVRSMQSTDAEGELKVRILNMFARGKCRIDVCANCGAAGWLCHIWSTWPTFSIVVENIMSV